MTWLLLLSFEISVPFFSLSWPAIRLVNHRQELLRSFQYRPECWRQVPFQESQALLYALLQGCSPGHLVIQALLKAAVFSLQEEIFVHQGTMLLGRSHPFLRGRQTVVEPSVLFEQIFYLVLCLDATKGHCLEGFNLIHRNALYSPRERFFGLNRVYCPRWPVAPLLGPAERLSGRGRAIPAPQPLSRQ